MSIVLQFPKQPHPRSPRGDQVPEYSAKILFFTGVRIERHVEEDLEVTRPQRGGSTNGKRRRKA